MKIYKRTYKRVAHMHNKELEIFLKNALEHVERGEDRITLKLNTYVELYLIQCSHVVINRLPKEFMTVVHIIDINKLVKELQDIVFESYSLDEKVRRY